MTFHKIIAQFRDLAAAKSSLYFPDFAVKINNMWVWVMEIDLLVTTHNVTDLFKIFNFGSNVKLKSDNKPSLNYDDFNKY